MSGRQYNAACPKCTWLRAVTRAEIETGRAPLCEHCGTEMTVRALPKPPRPSRAKIESA